MSSYTSQLESLLALRLSFSGNFDTELTAAESRRNIRNNVVRLFDDRAGTTGSGLRLTTDGYILTANHVFDSWKRDWGELLRSKPTRNISRWREKVGKEYYVVVDEKTAYPLDISFWYSHPNYDLGLLKATVSEEPLPIRFKHRLSDPVFDDPVSGYFRDELGRRMRPRRGRIVVPGENTFVEHDDDTTRFFLDTCLTTINIKTGESGSPIVSPNGELLGLAIFSVGDDGDKKGFAGYAKSKHVPALLDYVLYHRLRGSH